MVRSREGPYATIQYYNTKGKDKDKELQLVWYRQNPEIEGEEYEETFTDKLTQKQQKQGYMAWTEQIHLNLFYQRLVEAKDMKVTAKGRHVTPLRRAAIKQAGPITTD